MRERNIRQALNEIRRPFFDRKDLSVRRVTVFHGTGNLGFEVFERPRRVSSDGVEFPLVQVQAQDGIYLVQPLFSTAITCQTVSQAVNTLGGVLTRRAT